MGEMPDAINPAKNPQFTAAIDLLGRSGMRQFQLRWSDDEEPTVWFAVALYDDDRWETAAGHHPVQAVLRLCEQLIDGGTCTHCGRPTGFDESFDTRLVEMLPSACWYLWDPELAKFRRGCE